MDINPQGLLQSVHILVVAIDKPDSVHYRRRTFFSLAGAQKALDRASERGQVASMVLCRLEPVGDE